MSDPKNQTRSQPIRVSSPAATGGAGTFFEQHVNAYWLAQLLVRGIPPILRDCTVNEVHLQTEHLGFNTDDFLIVAQNGAGASRKLVGQVKRTFTVSSTDDECRKAVQDFWKDFENPHNFVRESDRFALVTLRGTNTLLEHFSGLLDCARTARDASEFEQRLATPGFLSTKASDYCNEIRAIVGELKGRDMSRGDVWPFLRVLHVLSLDLNTATAQTEVATKSILAHTVREHDRVAVADATWNALLREVGGEMPQARSFRWDDLPQQLRSVHAQIGGVEWRALQALSDHSALILDGIHSTLGHGFHLTRSLLVNTIITQMASTQVVLISGPAGSGKSGIAKSIIEHLAKDHFVFSFRAEEFANPHFDAVLQRSQIPCNARTLGSILAGQVRKVLLVESIERLLEASTRDAFADLLNLVARDPSWRVILTCRDYSSDLVRAGLLEPARILCSVVAIPPLSDSELEDVARAHAPLARPLASPSLRRLLQNPYVLDKAIQIDWTDERPLPQSERELRERFWRDVVRAELRGAGGMPQRREAAFIEVALRRARALTLHALCQDLDPEVVHALKSDSLIVARSGDFAAPSHDVLEDWAILRWIDQQHIIHEGSAAALSSALGTYPAIRRTYRKWVSELVAQDLSSAEGLFRQVVRGRDLPTQFSDDTLVSLLRSPDSPGFLEKHTAELFASDKQLLRRVIHLLKVACVTLPNHLANLSAHGSVFDIPEGPAWACVMQLVRGKLQTFDTGDHVLLLAFTEHWAKGVSWHCPYPEGAEDAAAIAHWLLPHFADYGSQDNRKRTLQVIAKIPNADCQRFVALLHSGNRDSNRRSRTTEYFHKIIFKEFAGVAAARDMPVELAKAARDYLLCTMAEITDGHYEDDSSHERLFGLKRGVDHGYLPPSADRGPFWRLLQVHPNVGLDFIISVLNHSADWYASPRVYSRYVEPPGVITLTFADGSSKQQWCNSRLWNWYRGTSVGPYVLQSLLMALERWLLDYADAFPKGLDRIMLDILRCSDSAAVTAVVASVATAFPRLSGETLLVLLGCPSCIRLDRYRLVSEMTLSTNLFRISGEQNKIYESERNKANSFRHRKHDLEFAITDLQLGSLAPRVYALLDRFHAEMRPVEEQGEEDRLWRLAMHRMDLRHYTVAGDVTLNNNNSDNQTLPDEPERSFAVRLEPGDLAPDIQEMVNRSSARNQLTTDRRVLLMWGVKVFERAGDAAFDPEQWRLRLQEARAIKLDDHADDEELLHAGGPGIVAAICVRDRWDAMTEEERDWCLNRVCFEVEQTANDWNSFRRMQRYNMAGDRPCASVVPLLLGKQLTDEQRSRARTALVFALTHPIDEVRTYAASGIGSSLWGIDRELALRCVAALSKEIGLLQRAIDIEHNRRPDFDGIHLNAASTIRTQFYSDDLSADRIEPADEYATNASARILTILSYAPNEPLAVEAFARATKLMATSWQDDDDYQRGHSPERVRDFDTEQALIQLLAKFLLQASAVAANTILKPVLDVMDRHPKEVERILQYLIFAEDGAPATVQFWSIWALFAEKVRSAKWLARIDEEYATGREMMSTIFLGLYWNEGVSHWRSLDGRVENLHCLFEQLPGFSTVLESYVEFLYRIGRRSLPEAFVRIAKKLAQGNARQMMRKSNTIYMLEVLLQQHVYGKPLELKSQRELREAVLLLLDVLVESGSSAAFRMRDDFVTPISIN